MKKLKIPSILVNELSLLLNSLLITRIKISVPINKQDVRRKLINASKKPILNVLLLLRSFPKKKFVAKKIDIETADPIKKPVKYV
ncbi:MAG: hypothetical protein ACRCRQ_00725 [Metamycoplasmataceae bacterium]